MLGLRRFVSFACVFVCLGCPAEGDENDATTTPPATTTMSDTDDGDDAPATTLPDPTNPTDPTNPGDSTGAPSADCCTAHAGGGCDDAKIEACVCEEDAVCCQFDWDALCVNTARTRCEACGGGGGDETTGTTTGVADTGTTDPTTGVADTGGGMPGECCEASKSPGCSDAGIETCVCTQDDYCCMTAWDGLCVDQAVMDCGANCMFDTGCCVPHPSVGCDDMGVQDCVCAMDPFCCDRGWDNICVEEVDDFMCGSC
jgi:hypothetical protein